MRSLFGSDDDLDQRSTQCSDDPVYQVGAVVDRNHTHSPRQSWGDLLQLPLPPLRETTAAALRMVLPEFIPPTNPLDVTAQALVDPDLYRRALPPILADDQYGSLVLAIILTPIFEAVGARRGQDATSPQDYEEAIAPVEPVETGREALG